MNFEMISRYCIQNNVSNIIHFTVYTELLQE